MANHVLFRSIVGSTIRGSVFRSPLEAPRPPRLLAMPTWFAIWCPLGDVCTKRGRQIARHDSEDKVRAALINHLACSPFHADLSDEDRRQWTATAHVEVWDEEQEVEVAVKAELNEEDQQEEEEQTKVDSPSGSEADTRPAKWVRRSDWDEGKSKGSKGFKGEGKSKSSKGKGWGWKGKNLGKGISKDDLTSAVASGVAIALQQ